jgi:hypothetical protein
VVCNEVPYPAVSGGRSDVWQRLVALRRLGVAVHLITWYVRRYGAPTGDDLGILRGVADELNVLPVSLGPRGLAARLIGLLKYPAHVSSRAPSKRGWAEIGNSVSAFRPDAVWLDGLYGGAVAMNIAAERQLPLFYRSHNIEHRYMRAQAAAAHALQKRLALRLACVRLREFEQSVIRKSVRQFEISLDDLRFWREQGLCNGVWLPPIVCPPDDGAEVKAGLYDLVFVGSLSSPNNIEGLVWLVDRVLPELRRARGSISVAVAGSRPTRRVRRLCEAMAGVSLIVDPKSPWTVYRSGRVLVNPAQRGSGVQIKTVEMLHTDAPIVCTPVGAQGLPALAKSTVRIADSPAAFVAAIESALARPEIDRVARVAGRKLFSPETVRASVLEMQAVVSRR